MSETQIKIIRSSFLKLSKMYVRTGLFTVATSSGHHFITSSAQLNRRSLLFFTTYKINKTLDLCHLKALDER